MLIGKQVWDGLDATHQSMLSDAAREVGHLPAAERGAWKARRSRASGSGMVVTRLPDGEARKMADLPAPGDRQIPKPPPADVLAWLLSGHGAHNAPPTPQ